MQYRPNLGYKYPEKSDEHMIYVKHLRDVKLDEDYRYYRKDLLYKIYRGCLFVLLNLLVFPVAKIWFGIRIHGKKNLKENKKLLKKGAITICNHVFYWDYLCILKAIRPHIEYFPAWKTNLEGPNGTCIRWVGGIPVPTDNKKAMVKFNQAICEVIEDEKWLHFFPEGSMWLYYPDIRPLKKAVFKYAVRYNKPIIPMAFTFRPRKGLFKLFTKTPHVDLHIGKPMLPDLNMSPNESIEKMRKEAYHIMQELAGIKPGDFSYNSDLSISHYKKTM